MADISSYPQATPKGSDRVLGVQAYVEGDDSTAGNPTKTFTINDINNLVPKSDGDSLYIDTEISSAQILDLQNTPVTIIPAQGDGTQILVSEIFIKYSFGTIPYTQGGDNSLRTFIFYTDINGITAIINPLIDSSINSSNFSPSTTSVTNPPSNEPVILVTPPSSPITLGDGTIKIRTYYNVIPSTF